MPNNNRGGLPNAGKPPSLDQMIVDRPRPGFGQPNPDQSDAGPFRLGGAAADPQATMHAYTAESAGGARRANTPDPFSVGIETPPDAPFQLPGQGGLPNFFGGGGGLPGLPPDWTRGLPKSSMPSITAEDSDPIGQLEYWGDVKPIKIPVIWDHRTRIVEYYLLTMEDEEMLRSLLKAVPPELQIIGEAEFRAVYAVLSIDKKPITMDPEARLAWVRRWPGPLLDAILAGYILAGRVPFTKLAEIVSDPNIAAALLLNGVDSTVAASLMADS